MINYRHDYYVTMPDGTVEQFTHKHRYEFAVVSQPEKDSAWVISGKHWKRDEAVKRVKSLTKTGVADIRIVPITTEAARFVDLTHSKEELEIITLKKQNAIMRMALVDCVVDCTVTGANVGCDFYKGAVERVIERANAALEKTWGK